MSSIIQENQVVYVEPNAIDDVTSYETAKGKVNKSVDLEDLCISVDLDVEVKGRTYAKSTDASNSNIEMSWQSSKDGEVVRFMGGTKIPTGINKEGFVNSLTTNYTDCYLYDVLSEGTCEMFGIKSIDISYNNFMVPEVTIQFIDVRGVSLFAQEEMRHNVSRNGMDGVVNNNVEGSFFKCFFTFPYPKFTLKVKGLYGDMASYELTCSDFRSSFDSNTGNFNVTAKFIGYQFSFFNDVMVNAIVAAPYSEYLGRKYWDDNNGSRFTVTNSVGMDSPMQRLGELCRDYMKVKKDVAADIEKDGFANVVKKELGLDVKGSTEEDNVARQLKEGYQACIKKLESNKTKPRLAQDTVIHPDGTNSYIYVLDCKSDDEPEYITEMVNAFSELNEKIRKQYNSIKGLDKWSGKVKFSMVGDYGDVYGDNNKVNTRLITDPALQKELEKYISNKSRNWSKLWSDGLDSLFYVYNDLGLKDVLGTPIDVATTETENNARKIQEKAEERIIRKKLEEVIGFPPTVENITKVIMAHFETYVYCISRCASNIINSNRTTDSLGVTVQNFPDIIGNNSNDSASSNVEVAPFPEVTEKVTLDGVTKNESSWIGKFGGPDKFEEVSLVEGILAGIEHVSDEMNKYVSMYESPSGSIEKCGIKNAISFTDLFVKGGENPFGKVKLDDADDVFARFCVRAFTVIGTQNVSEGDNVKALGMLDAESFYDKYKGNSSIGKLRDSIADITTTKIIRFVNSGTERLVKNAKSNPWYRVKQLIQPYGNMSYMYVGDFSDKGRILPIKDWTWKEWGYSYETGKGLTTSKLDKFILTDSAKVKGRDDVYVDDSDSMIVKIMESPVSYMRGCYNQLCNSEYADDTIKERFKCLEFNKESLFNGNYVALYDTNEKKYKNISSVISYTDSGSVERADGLTFTWNNGADKPIFFTVDYNNKVGDYEKAECFLSSLTKSSHDPIDRFDKYNKPSFRYVYKLQLLQWGARIWKKGNEKSNETRKGISDHLMKYFKEWVETSFKDIKNTYELKLKKGVTYDDFIKYINGYSGDDLKERISKKVEDWAAFNKVYNVEDGISSTKITYESSDIMSRTIMDLLQVTAVCFTTKFNTNGISLSLKTSQLKAYLDGVLTVLGKELTPKEDVDTAELTISKDNDDIKIGLYNYIKMLYDKWISSDLDNSNYKLESMFYDEDHSFHFIDSAYNKIGKSMYLNLGVLVDTLIASQFKNGYSMLSMLSELYAINKFQFMCLQNFADLSNPEMMQRMFKPIPYIDATRPANHPDFVVLYPYEASSHLDVDGADYPDDSFYLNDKTTWPVMISEKNSSNGYSIPAFGVTYGQQYQSYFRNIQVDMNAPMATEQSIKAKFLVCGANGDDLDNGPREATIGQDLYTIYSNNSYTCTVTMLGCAWVQPMMYFVLNNIPMFRGSYLIFNVSHQIEPGNMTTTFKGIRMSRNSTRAVRSYIYGETTDSTCGSNPADVTTRMANIGNDCSYAYVNPLCPNISDMEIGTPTNASASAYCAVTYNALKKVVGENGAKGVCANIFQESGFEPYMLTIDGNNQSGSNAYHCAGGGLCSFRGVDANGRNGGEAVNLFMYAYNIKKEEAIKKLQALTNKVEPYWHGKVCSQRTKNEIWKANIRFPISFEAQVRYICKCAKQLPLLSSSPNPSIAADVWMAKYERPQKAGKRWADQGEKVMNAIQSNSKSVSVEYTEDSGKTYTNWDYMHGLEKAVEYSLRATESYSNTRLSIKKGVGRWAKYYADGADNATNAMFDCLLNTYWKWADYIYWDVGGASMDADAVSVIVHITSTPPSKQVVAVTSNHDVSKNEAGKIPKIGVKELNPSLKLSLIKYFRNRGISSASGVKAIFRQFVDLQDSKVEEVFELTKGANESSVKQCISISGQYAESCISSSELKNGNFSNKVSNEKMKRILSNVASLKSDTFGRRARQKGHKAVKVCDGKYSNEWQLQKNEYNGNCVSGPTTWYRRAGINLTWWNGVNGTVTYSNSKHCLEGCGMVAVWHGTISQLNSKKDLRPGDIATLYKGVSGRQHGMMWTGVDWRSDCIQNNAMTYSTSNQGDFAAVLWRHPSCQDNNDVKHFKA